jgi:hypothetical protein
MCLPRAAGVLSCRQFSRSGHITEAATRKKTCEISEFQRLQARVSKRRKSSCEHRDKSVACHHLSMLVSSSPEEQSVVFCWAAIAQKAQFGVVEQQR